MVGRPRPPLWALGHQQCRWGYKSQAELDARSWRHYLPRLIEYAFAHPDDPAMAVEATVRSLRPPDRMPARLTTLSASQEELEGVTTIGKSLDLVEQTMVECFARLADRAFDVLQMHHQAGPIVGFAGDGDAHAEGMSVHPRIGMTGRRRRQEMGGFEEEFFVDAHGDHNSNVMPGLEPGIQGDKLRASSPGLPGQARQ